MITMFFSFLSAIREGSQSNTDLPCLVVVPLGRTHDFGRLQYASGIVGSAGEEATPPYDLVRLSGRSLPFNNAEPSYMPGQQLLHSFCVRGPGAANLSACQPPSDISRR